MAFADVDGSWLDGGLRGPFNGVRDRHLDSLVEKSFGEKFRKFELVQMHVKIFIPPKKNSDTIPIFLEFPRFFLY